METLSPELLNLVVSYLEPPLAPYSTVSKRWQCSIENRTFSSVKLNSDDESFQQFDVIFAKLRRRSVLKTIDFLVILPSVSLKRMKKLQSNKEATVNNESFTRAIISLFTRLHFWDVTNDDKDPHSRIHLILAAESPSDLKLDELEYNHYGPPIWEFRNDLKYISFDTDLLKDSRIPTVSIVSKLTGFTLRKFDPSALRPLLSALPYLRHADWSFYSPPPRLAELRRRMRSELAPTLLQLDLLKLTHLELYWEDYEPFRQTIEPNGFIDPGSSADPLSLALRHLGDLSSLTRLLLTGCHSISAIMFSKSSDKLLRWPALREFYLEASTISPSGQWYFTGDPSSQEPSEDAHESLSDEHCSFDSADSDRSDFAPQYQWERDDGLKISHRYRTTPDNEKISPLIVAMVQAVQDMQKLEKFEFVMGQQGAADLSVEYFPPGKTPRGNLPDDEALFNHQHANEARWYIRLLGRIESKIQWRPDATVLEALSTFTEKKSVLLNVDRRYEILD